MKSLRNKIILVDFGATRVKAVVVDTDTKQILDTAESESPSVHSDSSESGHFEIAVSKYSDAFKNTALELLDEFVKAIYICSEMHGFALLDTDTNKFTPYISWKDTRVDVNEFKNDAEWFLSTTGMKLRPGLPFINVKPFLVSNKKYQFFTLVDAVLHLSGCRNIKSNFSLAASTGLVDINKQEWLEIPNLEFHELVNTNTAIAELDSVKIYGGIGDLQAAVLGAGDNDNVVFNLGTGSQVICKDTVPGYELRPYVNGNLRVITHIPSGRALNVFANFFNSIAADESFFWQEWSKLTAEQVLAAQDSVDLNVFDAAWGFTADSGFIQFREGRSNFKMVLADIAKSWVLQYTRALAILDPDCKQHRVSLSGGLAHKSNFLVNVLSALDTKRTYQLVTKTLQEETHEGLFNLYLINENSNTGR